MQDESKTQIEISEEFNISETLLSNINLGLKYRKNIEYPIRKNYKSEEDYEELVYLLKNTRISFLKIAEKLQIGESTVKKINYGTLRRGLSEEYPIRKMSGVVERALEVKNLLLNSDFNVNEIAKITQCSVRTVRRINSGETHFDLKLSYPLRK